MAQLPINVDGRTRQQHKADHEELHRLHNILDSGRVLVAQAADPINANTSLWNPSEIEDADVLIVTASSPTVPPWQSAHTYAPDDVIVPTASNDHFYRASSRHGVTGVTEPEFSQYADHLQDNTVLWHLNVYNAAAFGDPVMADAVAWRPNALVPGQIYPTSATIIANGVRFDATGFHDNEGGHHTGGVEPDWSSVPSFGDTIVDNEITWKNSGTCFLWSPNLSVQGNAAGATTQNLQDLVNLCPAHSDGPIRFFYYALSETGDLSATVITSSNAEPTFPTDGSSVADNYVRWYDIGTTSGLISTVSGIVAPTTQRAIQVVNAGPEHLVFEAGGSGPTAILDPGGDGPFNLIPGGSLGFAHTANGWLVMLPYFG